MNNSFKAAIAMTCVIAFSTALAPRANAGCASIEGLRPAAYSAGPNSPFVLASYNESLNPIVGLWQVTFISKGSVGIPDGTQVDAGYATWHSDGTELMNSGKAPVTSSFCMGVWTQTSRYTYVLNHFALSWDPTGTVFVGPANIKENITLDYSGTAFSGTFTITQFDTHSNTLATVTGTITGTRITVDTP